VTGGVTRIAPTAVNVASASPPMIACRVGSRASSAAQPASATVEARAKKESFSIGRAR
jgi:hypothetical protein